MQEELNEFDRSKLWYLVSKLLDRAISRTRRVFRIKLDGTFSPVVRTKAIRIWIKFATDIEFKMF